MGIQNEFNKKVFLVSPYAEDKTVIVFLDENYFSSTKARLNMIIAYILILSHKKYGFKEALKKSDPIKVSKILNKFYGFEVADCVYSCWEIEEIRNMLYSRNADETAGFEYIDFSDIWNNLCSSDFHKVIETSKYFERDGLAEYLKLENKEEYKIDKYKYNRVSPAKCGEVLLFHSYEIYNKNNKPFLIKYPQFCNDFYCEMLESIVGYIQLLFYDINRDFYYDSWTVAEIIRDFYGFGLIEYDYDVYYLEDAGIYQGCDKKIDLYENWDWYCAVFGEMLRTSEALKRSGLVEFLFKKVHPKIDFNNEWVELKTSYTDLTGSRLCLFVKKLNDKYCITDYGNTLNELELNKIELKGKQKSCFDNILLKQGCKIGDLNDIRIEFSNLDDLPIYKHQLAEAIKYINDLKIFKY